MNDLERLAAELAALPSMQKAMGADQNGAMGTRKIKAAADDGEEISKGDVGDGGNMSGPGMKKRAKKMPPEMMTKDMGGDMEDDEEDGESDTFGKSFKVTMPDGSEQDAYDGTAMMKALHADVEALRDEVHELRAERETMTKALTLVGVPVKDMHATVVEQGALIKALQADLARIGNTGSGRRAALTVHEKSTAPAAGAMSRNVTEIMAKALDMQAGGKLTAREVVLNEQLLKRGSAPTPEFAAALGLTS